MTVAALQMIRIIPVLAATALLAGLPSDALARKAAEEVVLTRVPPPARANTLAPNVAAGPDGVYLSWVEVAPKGHSLRLARWDGAQWSSPKTIVSDRRIQVNEADAPALDAFEDGSLAVQWTEPSRKAAGAFTIYVSHSPNGGRNWTRPAELSSGDDPGERGFVSFLDPGKGKPFSAVWLDGSAKSGAAAKSVGTDGPETKLAVSRWKRDGFEAAETLDPRVCDCCATTSVRTSEGLLIAYRDRSASELRDISTVLHAGGTWTAPRTLSEDGWKTPACPVNGPAAAARGDSVTVAWYTAAKQEPAVKVAFSSDGGKTFGVPVRADLGRPAGQVDIEWVAGGYALLSWVERTGDRVVLQASWVRAEGVMGEPIEIADLSKGGAGSYPRMTRKGAEVFFAWTEGSEKPEVKVVRMRGLNTGTPRFVRASRNLEHEAGSNLGTRRAKNTPGPRNEPSKDFFGKALDGSDVRLSKYKGKVVLLSFFGTWCPPCRREIPELNAMRKRHRSKGFEILSVSAGDDRRSLESFVRTQGMKNPVVQDRGFTDLYDVTGYPTNLVVDKKGRIRYRSQGYSPGSVRQMETLVEELLRE